MQAGLAERRPSPLSFRRSITGPYDYRVPAWLLVDQPVTGADDVARARAAGGSHHHAPCRFDTRSSPLNVSLNNPWGRVTRCGGYAILRPARCEAPAAPGQHPSQERSPRRRARLRLSSRPRGPHRQGRVRGSLRSWDGKAQSRRSHQWWVPARRPAPRARCAASRRSGRRAAGASPSIATARRSPPAACRPGPAPQARRATARPRLQPDRGGARC